MIIEKVTAHFTRKLDTGYHPYMDYLDTLNGRPPAFGTRENSNSELGVYVSAMVEEGEDPEQIGDFLTGLAKEIVISKMRQLYPFAFGADAAAFMVDSTEVVVEPEGEF